jgi:hypothetical protein
MEISMGHWWDYIGRGKPKYSQESLTQCHFVQHYFTWTDLGSREDCRFCRPAMNSLKHGTTELCLKVQLGPRSKHSVSVVKVNQLMLYRAIIAVCSEQKSAKLINSFKILSIKPGGTKSNH